MGDTDIKIVKLNLDNLCYKDVVQKKAIVLHHTVSSNVEGVLKWWEQRAKSTDSIISTAYVIDFDGTVYEVFDPKYWAYHTGIGASYDRRSIGIEFVNEGPLVMKSDNTLLTTFGFYRRSDYYKHPVLWRGYQYFASYPKEQVIAGAKLVRMLCERFGITFAVYPDLFTYSDDAKDYNGIVAHCTIRKDKTDVSVAFPLDLFLSS